MRHLGLRFGPLTVVVVFSRFWLCRGFPFAHAALAGGASVARLGPVVLTWWSPRKGCLP
jgi:hypothetical protein